MIPKWNCNGSWGKMKKYKKHIFVCNNIREGGPAVLSCGRKNGDELRLSLKKMVSDNGLKKDIRVNRAGCLGACEHGPVMVIYPQGIYYGGFNKPDLDEIFKKSILKNEIIDRLVIEA